MIAGPLTYKAWRELVAEIRRGLEERAAADFVPEPWPTLVHPDDLVLLECFAGRDERHGDRSGPTWGEE